MPTDKKDPRTEGREHRTGEGAPPEARPVMRSGNPKIPAETHPAPSGAKPSNQGPARKPNESEGGV